MPFSVIIPSANADNLVPCVRAIMECEPELDASKIIVIDDGAKERAEKMLPDLTWIEGRKPFCFSRNCNLGIAESSPWDDIILLNDDALLKTPGGFSAMVTATAEWDLLAAVTNCAGNPNQQTRCGTDGVREEPTRALAFICVCIPRQTLDRVGVLDERFTTYGWEDVDYCKRVRAAGMKLGIFDGCFVDHLSLESSYRGAARNRGDIAPGRDIYFKKHGTLEAH